MAVNMDVKNMHQTYFAQFAVDTRAGPVKNTLNFKSDVDQTIYINMHTHNWETMMDG